MTDMGWVPVQTGTARPTAADLLDIDEVDEFDMMISINEKSVWDRKEYRHLKKSGGT